jgi:hypothetical protein
MEADRVRRILPRNFRLIANVVTFLPTMVALRRWTLPQTLSHEALTNELVDFMLRGLGHSP